MKEGFQSEPTRMDPFVKAMAEILRDFGTLCGDVVSGAFGALGPKHAVALFVAIGIAVAAPDEFGFFIRISLVLGLVCFGIIRYRNRD